MLVAGNEIRYVNILKDGLLEKREVFDANNSLIQKDSIASEMQTLPKVYNAIFFYNGQNFNFVRNGIVKNQKTISTIYTSSGAYSNTS